MSKQQRSSPKLPRSPGNWKYIHEENSRKILHQYPSNQQLRSSRLGRPQSPGYPQNITQQQLEIDHQKTQEMLVRSVLDLQQLRGQKDGHNLELELERICRAVPLGYLDLMIQSKIRQLAQQQETEEWARRKVDEEEKA